ncbi:MAG: serine hydrolase domain-containing protein, partial [bacterium]
MQIQFAYSQSMAEVQTRLDEYMNRLSFLGFSGALLVAKDGEVIFSKGYGMADRARQIPVTTETVFTTGSITKQFSAAAILKLEMQGKLSVHDPITKYFKKVPQDKTSITLHHLLTHTAGFKPALGYDFAEINREEFVQLALNSSLNHAPGEVYEYSNVGFSLLAAIVEQVSGQSYDAFLQKYLFKPAGMSKTGYVAPNWKRDEMAHGYKGDKDWGTFLDHPRADDGPYWHLRGNGGILSTVGDMYKWHLALEGKKVLSEEAKRKLYTPYVREGKGADSFYGYGWSIVTTRRGTRLITHNGGNPYFSADFLRYVDEDVVIYMVANTAEQRATRHSRQIARIVFGYDYILPSTVIETIPETELQNTAMGQHAQAFLEMLSSRDEQHTRHLIEQHFAPELLNRASMATHLRTLKSDQEEIGAVKYGQGVKAGENAIELTVQSKRSGEWWLLTLEFEPRPPHRIVGIGVTDTEPPAETKTTTTKDEEQNNFAEKWGLPNSSTGRRAAAFLETIER